MKFPHLPFSQIYQLSSTQGSYGESLLCTDTLLPERRLENKSEHHHPRSH